MGRSVAEFKRLALAAGVLHPAGENRADGQRLGFALIPDNSDVFDAWIDVSTADLEARYGAAVVAVVGVDEGTNRVSPCVARRLSIVVLYTRKTSPNSVKLTDESRLRLRRTPAGLVVALEDVGFTGGTALTAVEDIWYVDEDLPVEVQFTWQCAPTLPVLDQAEVPYHSIIHSAGSLVDTEMSQ